MFEKFLKENNIDFNKLGIDEVTSNKLKEFMSMSYTCYFSSKNTLNNNQDLANNIFNFCSKEDIETSFYKENLNFSGFLLALSIELNLKIIYILEEYNKIKNDEANIGKSNEEICNICLKQVRNEKRGHIETQNIAATNGLTIPKRNNGHYLISVLNNINNQSIKDLIKYETILAPLRKYFKLDKLPNQNQYIEAVDIISMIKEFDYTETIKTINETYIELSDSFEKMRYNEKAENIDNNKFLAAFSLASHMILCDILRKKMYTTQNLNNDLIKNPNLDFQIYNNSIDELNVNKQYYKQIYKLKQTNQSDYYVIVSKFNLAEVDGIIENFKSTISSVGVSLEFNDFLNYYIFFKRYIENQNFSYNENIIPNISKLFKTIRETRDLSKLGNQFVQWFNSIELSDLTEEERNLIEMIDPIYIYNSLTYEDKIIWQKCKEKNIKFEVYYKYRLNGFNMIIENFYEYFEFDSIPIEYLNNISRYDKCNKQDIEIIIDLSKNLGENIENIFKFYRENGIQKIKFIKRLIDLFKINFDTAVKCYQKCNLEEAKEVFDISNELDIPFEHALEFYKNYEKEDMKSLSQQIFDLKISAEGLDILYLYHSQDEIEIATNISLNTGIGIEDAISQYKDYSVDEIVQIKNLSDEIGEQFWITAEFLKKYNIEERKELIKILRENVFLLNSIQNLDIYYSLDSIKDIISISKELRIPLGYVVFFYGSYKKDDFKKIMNIVDKYKVSFLFADGIRDDYTREELNYLDALVNKIDLNLRTIVELYEKNYNSNEIELLSFLKNENIKYNSKMKILTIEEVLENIKLVGFSTDCVFYKTHEEIIKIKEMCDEESISFKPELLYFDLKILNKYLKGIDNVIENSTAKITIDDIEWVLEKAIKYEKEVYTTALNLISQLNNNTTSLEEIEAALLNLIEKNESDEKSKKKIK